MQNREVGVILEIINQQQEGKMVWFEQPHHLENTKHGMILNLTRSAGHKVVWLLKSSKEKWSDLIDHTTTEVQIWSDIVVREEKWSDLSQKWAVVW